MPDASLLPSLSGRESHLLASFLTLKFDIFKLAQQEKLLPHELLGFSQSPAVQAHLAALKAFAENAFALRSLQSRTQAIDLLESIANTSDNPIEKRRAASAILRGLNPVGGTPFRSVRQSPSLREGVGGRESTAEPSLGASATSFSALSPQSSSLPRPRTRPSPNFSSREAAEAISAALKDPNPENLATLHAFAAPGATLGQSQAPADLADFLDVARIIAPPERQAEYRISGRQTSDTAASYTSCLKTYSGAALNFDLNLERSSDKRWLYTCLKRQSQNTS